MAHAALQHRGRPADVRPFLADLPYSRHRREPAARIGRGGALQRRNPLPADHAAQGGTAGRCNHLWLCHRRGLRPVVQHFLPVFTHRHRHLAHHFPGLRGGRDAYRLHFAARHGADNGLSGQIRPDGQGSICSRSSRTSIRRHSSTCIATSRTTWNFPLPPKAT